MTNTANGCSALLLAAGFLVCFAAPSQAAEDAAAATPSHAAGTPVALHKFAGHAHHWKKYAHRKPGKAVQKASNGDRTADAAGDSDRSPAIAPSVANANAQLRSAQTTPPDTSTGNAAMAMTARANGVPQAAPDKPADALPAADAQSDAQVVAPDQLNDVDRTLRESTPPAPAAAAAAAAPLALASAVPVAANASESSTWDETSLIGKIFIGFGALLTVASAARMFMA